MKFLNKTAKGVLFVFTWIVTFLEVYLLSAAITNLLMGTAVLTVSIFSVVPAILSDLYWVLFLCISIPIALILMIVVILKMYSLKKEAKARNAALAKAGPDTSNQQEPDKEDKKNKK